MAEFQMTHPVDVYRPFEPELRKRLENFVSRVDKLTSLTSLTFFTINETLHVMGGDEGVRTVGSDVRGGSERMDPEHLIDLWLHGYFLHAENDKANELERWPIEHVPLWELCGAVRRLTNIFRIGREVVWVALEQDAATTGAVAQPEGGVHHPLTP